jgi:hypothetical protein
MMGPTPPSSTVSRVSSSVGVSGIASIAHKATATVLHRVLGSILGNISNNVNDALGSVVVQDTLVYRKLELGSNSTSGYGKWGSLSSYSRFVKNSVPEVSHALAHHPSVDE